MKSTQKSLPLPTSSRIASGFGTQILDDPERVVQALQSDSELDAEQRRQRMSQEQFRFEAEMEEKKIDREMKKSVAKIIFTFLAIETFAVFIILTMQGFRPLEFQVEDSTLNIFLGATILQISAMAIMVIRHLFPTKESS